jgi:hypothetical protein
MNSVENISFKRAYFQMASGFRACSKIAKVNPEYSKNRMHNAYSASFIQSNPTFAIK